MFGNTKKRPYSVTKDMKHNNKKIVYVLLL